MVKDLILDANSERCQPPRFMLAWFCSDTVKAKPTPPIGSPVRLIRG